MKKIIIVITVLIPFYMFGQAEFVEPELVSDEVFIKGDFNNHLNQKYIYKDRIYFMGADANHGSELWVSDGTPVGTYMLKDCTPNGNSEVYLFKANIDNLVFSVKDENGNSSLWATDGTKKGTIHLKDVIANVGFGQLQEMHESCGKIIFSGDDGVHGSEPWVTDGTPGGTYMIQDLGVNGGSNPWHFQSVGDKFVFTTNQNVGFKSVIWSTDCSKDSCSRIFEGNDGQSDIIDIGLEGQLLVINSFSDPVTNKGYTLISLTDGTPNGTFPILGQDKTLKEYPHKFTKIKDKVYFSMYGVWNNELYVTDGTEKGTKLLLETESGITDIVNWNDKLLFKVINAGSFISDGTENGTFNINELTSELVYFDKYNILDDKLYFGSHEAKKLFSIWVSDGTKSGTKKVKIIDVSQQLAQFDFFNSFDKNAVFSYRVILNRSELWLSNGTDAGTKQIAEFLFIPEFTSYSFTQVKHYGDYLLVIPSHQLSENYMFLIDRAGELTRVEPAGATRANKFILESGSAIVGELNGYLYFVANYYDTGEQLWRVKVGNPKSSVEETQQPELMTVYPNPAKDYIQLELTKPMKLSIISSTGAKVKDYGLVADGKLNVAELNSGVYFVVDEQGNNIAKFVKE